MLTQNLPQLAQDYTAAARTVHRLITPAARLPLRPHFPDFFGFNEKWSESRNPNRLLTRINTALAPFGASLTTVQHITIAYPQKDPNAFKNYFNPAHRKAERIRDVLAGAMPSVNWVLGDAIVELHRLDRSENQSVLHALTTRQEYGLRQELQATPLPWLLGDKGPHYTIMVDERYEQGTTLMNMASMLETNGFTVIGANIDFDLFDESLKQKKDRRNELKWAFYTKRKNYTFYEKVSHHDAEKIAQKLLTDFDTALAPHGLHHTTLSDNECRKIMMSLNGGLRGLLLDYNYRNFEKLIDDLKTLPASRPVTPRAQTPLRP